MLSHWQQRSHRRFIRQFQDLLELAEKSAYGVNRWLTFERLSVYLRISRRVLEPATAPEDYQAKLTRVVDIANVSTEAQYQRQGMFTRLISTIHGLTDMPIYVENAHSEFANHLLQHHGWQLIKQSFGVSYDLLHRPTPAAQAPSADRADATGRQ